MRTLPSSIRFPLWLPLFATLFCACSSAPRREVPAGAEVTLRAAVAPADARIGEYVSTWDGFRTSSYWIEGPTGLVLIDTQFLLSAGTQFVDWAEKATGKKAVLAIVLHPNPDKFNGADTFKARGIHVISSQQVVDKIPAVHALRTKWFYERFKPDYPSTQPTVESFGARTKEIEAAGLKLKLHVLGGPGCSDAHVVVQYENHAFVGDLVTQGFHSWLELGNLREWIDRLHEIAAMNVGFIHTGRGGSGDVELLGRQERYLRDVIAVLKKHNPSRRHALSDDEKETITGEIVARYPAYEFPLFIGNGLDASWKRLGGAVE